MGGNLGPPIGGIIILLGFSCLFFTICLKKYCKEKFLNQIIIELVLIIIIVFCVYRKNEKILLHLPENFTGDIIVVYEVDKAPKLESTSFFNPNIHVKVPENGKIFTSNNRKYNGLFTVHVGGNKASTPRAMEYFDKIIEENKKN